MFLGGCKPRNFSLIVDLFSLVDSTSLLLRCQTAIRLKIPGGDWKKKRKALVIHRLMPHHIQQLLVGGVFTYKTRELATLYWWGMHNQ